MLRTIFILLALLVTTPAGAQLTPLHQGVYWRVDAGVSSAGNRMCNINTMLQGGGGLHLKVFEGQPGVVYVQLFRNGWSMRTGHRVRLSMQIDSQPAWTGTASGRNDYLEVTFRDQDAARFLIEVAQGSRLRVEFPDGGTGSWTLNLTGSMAAMSVFLRCAEHYALGGGNPRPMRDGNPAPAPPEPAEPPARTTGPARRT